MISIITVTLGRELYLKRMVDALVKCGGDIKDIDHHIVFNGCDKIDLDYTYTTHQWKDKVEIGEALNRVTPLLKATNDNDLIIKLDDDAMIRSPEFFDHITAIHKIKPDAIFSPFPVGLINNFGGIQNTNRHVVYSKDTDTYYTFRKVDHVGGFARIAPAKYLKNFKFTRLHDEDIDFSEKHRDKEFFYLENALIIEHHESTLGQRFRYIKNN